MKVRDAAFSKAPTLRASAVATDVVTYFEQHADVTLCPVMDEADGLVGVISRFDFQTRMASPFGRALFGSKHVDHFVDTSIQIVHADDSVIDILKRQSDDRSQILRDGFLIVEEDGRYFGVISGLEVFKALHGISTKLIEGLTREVYERQRAEKEVRRLADADPLTGLLNRRVFGARTDAWVQRGVRFICAFVDLDRFKPLNDTYGHAVGDRVLKVIGERLTKIESVCAAARLGGDEFAFLVEDRGDIRAMAKVVDAVFDAVTRPISTDAGEVTVGASIGFAAFPKASTDGRGLLHAADTSMFRAKAMGGGVTGYDARVDNEAQVAQQIEASLPSAILNGNIRPALQPIVDVQSRRVVGHEVLARWVDSDFELDPKPSMFIPAAERAGVLDKLFWHIAGEAAAASTNSEQFLAFNVSPSQLVSGSFLKRLHHFLDTFDHLDHRIELEVTEHVLFRNMEESKRVLCAVKEMGARISLDDFGTGHSSLFRMSQLPFDKIKIDRCFLDTGENQSSLSILEAVISLCDKLGVQSCAEGIEDEATFEALLEMNCDQAQGYLLGRPELVRSEASAPLREAS